VSIFVGNLPFRAEQDDVIELFAPFGEVANCSLPLERDTGRKRGFAFVEMASDAEESKAIDELQNVEWMGRAIRVNKAEPRTGGGGGGGGGGRGGYGNGSFGGGGGYNGGGYGNRNRY
jgi:RNA recognition motif-containing protein